MGIMLACVAAAGYCLGWLTQDIRSGLRGRRREAPVPFEDYDRCNPINGRGTCGPMGADGQETVVSEGGEIYYVVRPL